MRSSYLQFYFAGSSKGKVIVGKHSKAPSCL